MLTHSYPKILLIGNDDAKSSVLEGILSDHTELRIARNLRDLKNHLASGRYDAVFCGWRCQTDTWRDGLEAAHKQDSDLPVLVFCHGGGEREWNEVIRAGGFDLLVAPYWKCTVLDVLEQAIASHHGRRPQSGRSADKPKAS